MTTNDENDMRWCDEITDSRNFNMEPYGTPKKGIPMILENHELLLDSW